MKTIKPFNGFCCLEHCLCEESDEAFEAITYFEALIANGVCDRSVSYTHLTLPTTPYV